VCVRPSVAAASDVVFTTSHSGDVTASITVPLIAGAFASPCRNAIDIAPATLPALAMGEGVVPGVPTPPPRG
jgi:hypothetical protein